MKSPNNPTPGEILASLPDARVDLTDPSGDSVSASGEHFTPVHALQIGVNGTAHVIRRDGVSALVTKDGGLVESTIGKDGKPTSITYRSPRRLV